MGGYSGECEPDHNASRALPVNRPRVRFVPFSNIHLPRAGRHGGRCGQCLGRYGTSGLCRRTGTDGEPIVFNGIVPASAGGATFLDTTNFWIAEPDSKFSMTSTFSQNILGGGAAIFENQIGYPNWRRRLKEPLINR